MFYNVKGGVGKSSFTKLMASFLKYKCNVNVAVVDYDSRLINYRQTEIDNLKDENPEIEKEIENRDIWPIINKDVLAIRKYKDQNLCGNSKWFGEEMKSEKWKDIDIVLIDLPGSFTGGEATELILDGMVGMCVIPTDRDVTSIRIAGTTANMINNCKKINQKVATEITGFVNCIMNNVSKKVYCDVMEVMKSANIKVLPDMVQFSERMKKMNGPDTMRSTLNYPDWNSKAFEGSKDLGIDNLLIDILKVLARTKDIPGTRKADMSFVNRLEKSTDVQARNRQLNGSSYPELEIPLSEEMKTSFWKNR